MQFKIEDKTVYSLSQKCSNNDDIDNIFSLIDGTSESIKKICNFVVESNDKVLVDKKWLERLERMWNNTVID